MGNTGIDDIWDWKTLKEKFGPQILAVKKNVILPQGQREKIGYVLEGMIYLCAENANAERSIVQFFRPGTFFFFHAFPKAALGHCYLTAKYSSRVAAFKEEDAPYLSAAVSQMLQGLLDSNFALHQKSIREKLLWFFQKERELQNRDTINMPIPYSDLADYLGAERSALMKEIRKLKEEGVLSGSNHTVKLNESMIHNF